MTVHHTAALGDDEAAEALLADAARALGDATPRGAWIQASLDYDMPRVLGALRARWPDLPLIGCTADGLFSPPLGLTDDGILLTLFSGDDLEVRAAVGDLEQGAGPAVAHVVEALGDLDPTLLLISPAAMTTSVSAVADALAARYPGVPIFGGTSADHNDFALMREFFGERVLEGSLPVLALRGSFRVRSGLHSGWEPVGSPMAATSSTGHVLHTLDDRPAAQIYRERWGVDPTRPGMLADYPLHVVEPDGTTTYLRAVFGVDEDSGALILAGDIAEGSTVRVAEGMSEGVLHGARLAAQAALPTPAPGRLLGALVVSCAARKWVLGPRAPEEVGILADALGDDTPVAGFYAFGEVVPNPVAPSYFNETCTLATLWGD